MDRENDDIWDRLKKKNNPAKPTNTQRRWQYKQGASHVPKKKQSLANKRTLHEDKQHRSLGHQQTSKDTDTTSSSKKTKGQQSRAFLDKLRQAQSRRKGIAVGSVAVIAIAGLITGGLLLTRDSPEAPQSLGVSSNGNQQITAPELSDEDPSFELLYREPYSKEDYRVVRSSPEGNAPAYTFIDRVDQTEVRITQQQVADIEGFSGIGEAAENFQATDVIQVDGATIYHGVNERSGVQSLITTKNGILILISSPRQLPDEVWVGYISSLR